jgi:hypothetical protein
MGWAWTAVIVGLLLVVASLVSSLAHGQGVQSGIILNDAEVIPVTGILIFALGFLVLLQEWSGLT